MADENIQENLENVQQNKSDTTEQNSANASADAKNSNEQNANNAETINNSEKSNETSAEKPAKESTEFNENIKTESAEDTLKKELEAANDRNLRLMAEFENFRRRSAKEQLDIIETANAKLLEKLSEVQDNFERAFAEENKSQDLATFEKGMQMIHSQFAKILSDMGLEQINPIGIEFDPNCHEALMQQASETIPEGHIITVFQKGYKLKNKILKTAKVIVSSGK